MSKTIEVTDAACALIERLKAQYGPLMFVLSGGCCDGSSPVCLRDGEFLTGPGDLLLGSIAGCPFYVDHEQYERWRNPHFVIDVAPGEGDTFSIEGIDGMHFVARTAAVTTTQMPDAEQPSNLASD